MNDFPPITIIYISEITLKRTKFPEELEKFNIKILEVAKNYEEIKVDPKKKPDVLVYDSEDITDDINFLIQKIRKDYPQTKLLVSGIFNSMKTAEKIIKYGADGYLDGHDPDGLESFAATITNVYQGKIVLVPSHHAK